MKIKGRGYITKKICRSIGAFRRKQFLDLVYKRKIQLSAYPLDRFVDIRFDILSISSKSDFAEQFFSILSFIVNVGLPPKWILVSDGSHSSVEVELIHEYFPFVEFLNWDEIPNRFPDFEQVYQDYVRESPMGKKIYILSNYLVGKNTLYTDSDILFYPKFRGFLDLLNSTNSLHYLPDNDWGTLDDDLNATSSREMFQLNGGFLLITPSIDWSKGLDYLRSRMGKYGYFSEQTACHVTFHNQDAQPFDPRIFLLITTDHFRFFNATNKRKAAIRHFVGPLRHKMWQYGWKWHLK